MRQIGERAYTGWCDCENQPTQLRLMHDAAGRLHYKHQCLRCGRGVGNAIAKHAVEDSENVPAFDLVLRERMELLAQFNRDIAPADTYATRQDAYRRYLNSPEWAEKRAAVLTRSKGICEGCLSEPATQVHHLTYDHIYNELLWELVAVCRLCHEKAHFIDGRESDTVEAAMSTRSA